MDPLHETVEVQSLLVGERQGVVEQIHQVRLAAPHPAPKVEPADRFLAALEQAPRPSRQRPMASRVNESAAKVGQAIGKLGLSRIGGESVADVGGVSF